MAKLGRPPFMPTNSQRELCQVLRAHGIAEHIIARNFNITTPTLKRAFKKELEDGFSQVKAAMISKLVQVGLGGNVNALIFWLKCWGGPEWRFPTGDSDPATPHQGNTTIIIRGGLPPEIIHDAGEESEPSPSPTRTNGSGNGTGHP